MWTIVKYLGMKSPGMKYLGMKSLGMKYSGRKGLGMKYSEMNSCRGMKYLGMKSLGWTMEDEISGDERSLNLDNEATHSPSWLYTISTVLISQQYVKFLIRVAAYQNRIAQWSGKLLRHMHSAQWGKSNFLMKIWNLVQCGHFNSIFGKSLKWFFAP